MPRRIVYVAVVGLGFFGLLAALHSSRTAAQPPLSEPHQAIKPPTPLPISQVVLFSSGVGYFQREGEVEGNSRVDLTFPVADVNDLLKSLVLQDLGGGRISAVRYDGADPLDKTLKSFALDLTGNPTFGELLNMARGEKIEVTLQQTVVLQPAQMIGTILGMEEQPSQADKSAHLLNLLCTEGVRSLPLNQVQRVRFLNPTLESELRKALEVLAGAHDMQKKTISLGFSGAGKRAVRVGYVVENPIWKTSYRLVVDKKGKLFLQSWASVENTTDEDWKDVRMALVSGRPISFQMDLYQPLYMPRPIVEPEQFASLRPPIYNGPITAGQINQGGAMNNMPSSRLAGLGELGGGLGGLGIGGGLGGGGLGGLPSNGASNRGANRLPGNRYKPFDRAALPRFPGQGRGEDFENPSDRLTYQEWLDRQLEKREAMKNAKKVGSALTRLDPTEGAATQATAEEIGDSYRYVLDEKITLPRQKSALLSILNQSVEGAKISIYNEEVQEKFPLLGLRFKNAAGKPLTQGPITVYEDGNYAGDARIRDLQPNEESLISYAIDQGVEVKTTTKSFPDQVLLKARVVKDQLFVTYTMRDCKTYLFMNRSDHDRQVLVEHPVRKDWKLEAPRKPNEQTRDVYRFEVAVPAGKNAWLEVVEAQVQTDRATLAFGSATGQLLDFNLSGFNAEVQVVTKSDPLEHQSATIAHGKLHLTNLLRQTVTYHLKNKSDFARTFEVEHSIVPGWKIVSPEKLSVTKEAWARFDLKAAGGQSVRQVVIEEQKGQMETALPAIDDQTIKQLLEGQAAGPKVKEALRRIQEQRKALAETQKELAALAGKLKEIADDQTRIRANLERVPPASDAYKRYLKKFDTQETEIEGLQDAIKQGKETEKKRQKEYGEYVNDLSIE